MDVFNDGETRASLDCRIRDQRERLSFLESKIAKAQQEIASQQERAEKAERELARLKEAIRPLKFAWDNRTTYGDFVADGNTYSHISRVCSAL